MNYFIYIVFGLSLFAGCGKEEILLTGDITGVIRTVNERCEVVPEGGDITVDLYRGSEKVRQVVTDSIGRYLFEDVGYGRYRINCHKNGFVREWHQYPLYHVGGAAETLFNLSLEEIPTYELWIDSITITAEQDFMDIHLKFNGDTILPFNINYFRFYAFMSNSPDVSKENYECADQGVLTFFGPHYETVASHGLLSLYDIHNFDQVKESLIYMILYPVATNQGVTINECFPEAIGKPSNIISFSLDDL